MLQNWTATLPWRAVGLIPWVLPCSLRYAPSQVEHEILTNEILHVAI